MYQQELFGPSTAAMVQENAQRIAAHKQYADQFRIRFPADAVKHLGAYANRPVEHFVVLSLDGSHCVIGKPKVVSVGLINRTIVHPREVFRPAIIKNAAAVVLCHNHPSGSCDPSPEDGVVTRRIKDAGEVVGIRMLDHIIIASSKASGLCYYSFLEHDAL